MKILLIILSVFVFKNTKAQYRAMVEVGMYKQQLYDNRSKWIQDEIYRLGMVSEKLFNENTMPPNFDAVGFRKKLWDKFVEYINSIRGYDFADNYQFNSIRISINSYENWFIENYNNIIKNQ